MEESAPIDDHQPAGQEDAAGASDPAELDALRAEIVRLKEESAKHLGGWQRAQADYDNLKKRSARDLSARVDQELSSVFLDLVGLADDLSRALGTDAETDVEGWRQGVELIQQKLAGLLERYAVRPIAAQGQAFDPNYHEAVGQAPGPDGAVVTEVQQGYLIRDRVLRPGRVIVGQGDASTDGADADASASPAAEA